MLARIADAFYRRFLKPRVPAWFFQDLVEHTENFGHVSWLGNPVWQNVFDLWILQETIAAVRPALVIETGTNRGGSALFMAHLCDLLGQGEIITIDVETLHAILHPRITFLLGDSVSEPIVETVRGRAVGVEGPILVTLDSDHSEKHVFAELEAYAPLVTPGSFCLVQDGVIDTLPPFVGGRPGPLPAIEAYLAQHPEFVVDEERCRKFMVTHHPRGWLRRV